MVVVGRADDPKAPKTERGRVVERKAAQIAFCLALARRDHRILRSTLVTAMQLPNSQTDKSRGAHRGEQNEDAESGRVHRTSTSNEPVRISRPGFAWTQIR